MEPLTTESAEQLFNECLKKHEAIVWKVVYSFSNDTISHQELYQDILLGIWRALSSFRGESRLSTWIYSVAFRIAMGQSRKRVRRNKFEVPLETFASESSMMSGETDDNQKAERNEKIQSLYRAIRQLSEVDRSLVLMHLDGLPYREIGSTMSMTESNVGARLTRIRKKLAELLKEEK